MDKERVKKILEDYGVQVINIVETPDILRIMVTAKLLQARNETAQVICDLDRPEIPKFQSEDEEREFWATRDSVDYADTASPVILEYEEPKLDKTTPIAFSDGYNMGARDVDRDNKERCQMKAERIFKEIQEHFEKNDAKPSQYMWLLALKKREGIE